jgi:hypothetical protein
MKGVIGGILLAVGILIMGASGLCTIAVIGSSFMSPNEWTGGGVDGFFGSLMIVLMFGGIPFLVGLGIFFLGRSLVRAERAETASASGAQPPPPAEAAGTDEDGEKKA